jgi:hypothetical protein
MDDYGPGTHDQDPGRIAQRRLRELMRALLVMVAGYAALLGGLAALSWWINAESAALRGVTAFGAAAIAGAALWAAGSDRRARLCQAMGEVVGGAVGALILACVFGLFGWMVLDVINPDRTSIVVEKRIKAPLRNAARNVRRELQRAVAEMTGDPTWMEPSSEAE